MKWRTPCCWLGLLVLATTLAGCDSAPEEPHPATETTARVAAFAAAWAGQDAAALSAFYGDEVKSYDATAPGYAFDKDTIDDVLRSDWVGGTFEVALTSWFVSPDGRFAAALGTYAVRVPGALVPQPYVSLLALENGQLVWIYDYYGGAMPTTEPMPTIPPAILEPGSAEAQAAVDEATAGIERWIAAYNGRDAAALLACYADEVHYVDAVSPDWRVLDRAQLEADVDSHFPRAEFESRLQPSHQSPIGPFLISADGRYAAVEGKYQDTGMVVAKPMVVILEFRDGAIVAQYNFAVMERDLLEP